MGLLKLAFELFGAEDKNAARLSEWRHGKIKKEFSLQSSGRGLADPFWWDPPPETDTLPDGWEIDENGHYTCRFPSVNVEKQDFIKAEREAYPAHLTAARLSADNSWSRVKMNAYWVGLRFHHWMGEHVPGFWDVFNYKRSENSEKVFRLTFEDQGEIVFYGTHGGYWGGHAKKDEENATLVVKNGTDTFRLLFESNVADPHRDICYPGQQDEAHVGFNLPANHQADNIITAYAIVHALGRMHREGLLKPLSPSGHKKPETYAGFMPSPR